jgi:serine/threonine protein phosphatase PrpC
MYKLHAKSSFLLVQLLSVSSIFCLEIQWGAAWRQGIRPEMQDAHILDFEQSNGKLFAIFDGHGTCCEKPCKHNAGLIVAEMVVDYITAYGYSTSTENLLKRAENLLKPKAIARCAGTTALVARITVDNVLHVNWAGDSRIVVFDKKGKIKLESEDHNWFNEQEIARAEKVGAEIVEFPEGVRRVAGMMPARTLGDFDAKNYAPGAVIAESEYAKVALKSGDVIIMACDGLWDVFSTQEAVDYYRDLQMIEAKAPELPDDEVGGTQGVLATLAWQMRDAAYRLDSLDNISVIVITIQ